MFNSDAAAHKRDLEMSSPSERAKMVPITPDVIRT
jgi:hypothetical protein